MKHSLMKAVILPLALGLATFALAQTNPAPEIDAGSAMNAVALLSGAVMLIRSRKR